MESSRDCSWNAVGISNGVLFERNHISFCVNLIIFRGAHYAKLLYIYETAAKSQYPARIIYKGLKVNTSKTPQIFAPADSPKKLNCVPKIDLINYSESVRKISFVLQLLVVPLVT